MAFYENTIIAKQDLAEKDLKSIKDKYNEIINTSSGKVIKIEEWGLLNLATKIKNYKKGFYIHYKFEGNKDTLHEIEKKFKIDSSIIRSLTVKYKKLDTKNEFFKKDK
jgi:small subunit ribosomal protein S6